MVEEPLTYDSAGVSISAAEQVVGAVRPHAARTARPEVLGELGGFSGLFALERRRWKQPTLVASCDGVGTKLELARQLDRFDTIGQDLVAMVVDDLVAVGAEPVLFCDYIAAGRLEVATVERIVSGIADGCIEAGCALVGGETAEHPGVMPAGQFDLAGFGLGIVERSRILGPDLVENGDEIVAMASNGLHSNGYSLARKAIEGIDLRASHDLLMQSLGDALLRPTPIYAPHCLALIAATRVRALCHVTGGGIPGNLPRILPEGLGAVIDASTFSPPDIFTVIADAGPVPSAEMWRTFNMGAGMLAAVESGRDAVNALQSRGVDAWVCGQVTDRGSVELVGVPR